MNEFEEKLNAVLNDPAELERIARLASELMGGASEGEPPRPEAGTPPFPDGELLGKLTKLLGSGGRDSDKTALVQALSPYLKPERQMKLHKALRMAKMARLARFALEDFGRG